jgi:hypothetical protein
VNRSSIENNVVSVFSSLRIANKWKVPTMWLDGFATDEVSGEFLRHAGVEFATLDCPQLNTFTHNGRQCKLTFLKHYLPNRQAEGRNSKIESNGGTPTYQQRLDVFDVTLSVGGMVDMIVKDLEKGISVQIFNSSKVQLKARPPPAPPARH